LTYTVSPSTTKGRCAEFVQEGIQARGRGVQVAAVRGPRDGELVRLRMRDEARGAMRAKRVADFAQQRSPYGRPRESLMRPNPCTSSTATASGPMRAASRKHAFAELGAIGQAGDRVVVREDIPGARSSRGNRGMRDVAGQALSSSRFLPCRCVAPCRRTAAARPTAAPERQRDFRTHTRRAHLLAQRRGQARSVRSWIATLRPSRIARTPGKSCAGSVPRSGLRHPAPITDSTSGIPHRATNARRSCASMRGDERRAEAALVDRDLARAIEHLPAVRRAQHLRAERAEHRVDAHELADLAILRDPLGVVVMRAAEARARWCRRRARSARC
jgi:hypothetical protein